MASIELLMFDARGIEDLSAIEHQGLLDHKEIGFLSTVPCSQRPIVMWSWILSACWEAMKLEGAPAPHFGAIQKECTAARVGVQTIHTYLNTQLPFAYVHLITFLVNLQNLVIAVKSGVIFALAWSESDISKMASQVFMCITVCVIYQGLLAISYVIQDPFGEDLLDFPIMAYSEYVAQSCSATYRAKDNSFFMDPDRKLFPQPKGTLASFSEEAKPAAAFVTAATGSAKGSGEAEGIQVLREMSRGISQIHVAMSEISRGISEMSRGISLLIECHQTRDQGQCRELEVNGLRDL
eukprot:gnl/MRDRNA2_/MRDRNA2_185019_c0_seq1.p1 gnl/MRDRNA2_/MRDRNA2_185019_c0~~gnl/MRDRNA2_/MRDRNA2_185019_c0_seq1.p1  ORF type:complete len:328 (+),score=43.39 gnl/MRDRNA2_/MRDRNA2_185019_c0_seq1:100-984(+)